MYNEELETLIDAALADGVLTEKEKQILFKKAQKMGVDLDEFEMVLDARLVKLKKAVQEKADTSAIKSNKLGDVKKCPVCGAIVSSLSGVCAECGFEFTGVDANLSSKLLAQKIDELLAEANKKKEEIRRSGKYSNVEKNGVSPLEKACWEIEDDVDTRIEAAIEHFAVPTTKNDLFEFIVFFKAKLNNKGDYEDSYRAKLDECFDKVKYVFPNDPIFKSLLEEKQKEKEIKEKKRKRTTTKNVIIGTVYIVLAVFVVFVIWPLDWKVVWKVLILFFTAGLLLIGGINKFTIDINKG